MTLEFQIHILHYFDHNSAFLILPCLSSPVHRLSYLHSSYSMVVCKNTSGALGASSKARIELGDVTKHNIMQMKRLNQVIFPVSYNDKFYADVQDAGELAKFGIERFAAFFE